MEINLFFEPVDPEIYQPDDDAPRKRIGDLIQVYSKHGNFPDLKDTDIAIVGVSEDRMSTDNYGSGKAPDVIRKHLYRLFRNGNRLNIADLGNIPRGHSIEDTYFALSSVTEQLLSSNILPVILGGSQDLTYAQYKGYGNLGQIINLLVVDPMFDLGKHDDALTSGSFLSKIILHQPNYLFNYTNLGYQSYYVDPDAVRLMQKLYFDAYRIGNVRNDMEEVEPIVRNSDMLSIDISAVRFADAPGNNNATPNGFYGEEICRIMRYAGISDKLTSVGIYEYNPSLDIREQTAKLIAQMIWYFIEGYYKRTKDYPVKENEDFLKFLVRIKDQVDEIVFYKSRKSERWWMEIPVESDLKERYERHYMVPCSFHDYKIACENNIPERWWQFYQKLV
ncbi:MAG: formimidoylglutamase [Bacteroidetes bacterium]|nr:formimidoylglutamase [Bacteroidota bacterium]